MHDRDRRTAPDPARDRRRDAARATRPAAYVRPAGDPRTEAVRAHTAALPHHPDAAAVTVDLDPIR